jgi:amino acid adenylation domain-containing protein
MESGVGELILRTARSQPAAPALRQDGRELSYGRLDEWSGALSARIGPGRGLVGILMPRVPENIVAMLAVLRAGAAYVPLDPGLPVARLRFMIEDAGLDTVIVDGSSPVDGLDVARLIDVHDVAGDATPILRGGDAPCYVIYTSGTTGRPKGVLAHHRAVVNYLSWACQEYGITAGARVLLHSPLTFDLSVTTTLAPLVAGAVIEMTAGDDLDGLIAALRDTAEPYQLVKLTPAHLQVLNIALADELSRRVLTRCLVVGGENLPADRARPWHRSRVINEYGPTETVVGCTVHEVTEHDVTGDVPIGRPIANTVNHVLDEHRQPVPDGVTGELWVGGTGVTLGYLNRPALTAERFTADPFVPGARMYRTGDLAVRGADGLLRCLGRTDDQVKVRGYRVELGEVENVLRTLPGVRDAAVAHDRGRLLAAVVAPGAEPDRLLSAAREFLAEHMVPTRIVVLDRLPLTTNGKVDRAALLRDAPDPPAAAAPVGESDPALAAVLDIASDILARPQAPDADFFAAGGTSLDFAVLCTRLARSFGVPVPISEAMRRPTARLLAEWADDRRSAATTPVEAAPTDDAEVPLTPMQTSFLMRQAMDPGDISGNCPLVLRIDGELDRDALTAAFGDLTRRQGALTAAYTFDAEDRPVAVLGDATGQDIAFLPGADGVEADGVEAVADFLMRPFDTEMDAPWRAAVVPVPGGTILGVAVHHIAFDGYSENVLVDDLSRAYTARLGGAAPRFPAAAATPAETWRAMRDWTAGVDLEAQRRYWRNLLDGVPDLEMAGARSRDGGRSSAARTHTVEVGAATTAAVTRAAREHATTPFAVALSALSAALARVTGQHDFGLGVTVSRRAGAAFDGVVGCFVETLCLRMRPDAEASPAVLLKSTLPGIRAALSAQDIPFAEVVRLVNPPRSGRDPLYQVLFVHQERRWTRASFGGHAARPVPMHAREGVCELVVELWPQPDGRAVIDLTYQTRAVAEEFIERLAPEFVDALRRFE